MADPTDSGQPEGLPAKLFEHAEQLQHHAEQLATGLARLSASPEAVKAVQQCAQLGRELAKSLGKEALKGRQAEAAPAEPEQPAQGQPRSIGEATQQMY